MATNINWPPIGGATFSIPAAGEVGWPSLSDYLIALQDAQSTGAQKIAVRTATTSPVNVVSASDCVVRIERGTPGATTVNLPAGVTGQYFVIVDGLGDAASNNITIVPNGVQTINGDTSLVLDTDFGAYALVFQSGNWTVTASFGASGAGSVPRSDIAPGTPDYVVINSNTGALSEEQYLSQSRGGFGENVSAYSGVVKAVAGDFSASTIVNADISASAAIDTTKLADGSISNTEFQYLNGVTSNIQNQINAISGAGITSLTGDVTATGPGAAAATIANGAVTDAKVASGIDAVKIGAGSVDNTEFSYLNGVTSLIQTQLDGKQPLDADLTAIAGLSSTGLIARTGAGTASVRTITGTTNLIDITNGDGVSGNPTITVGTNVVTLAGTQALTNKDYDGGTASNTSRLTVPKAAYATLAALTRKEGTLVYATDQDLLYADDGTNLIPVGSGTGIGQINIIDNPVAAASTTGWTAATNYTVSRDTSNSPLAGVIDTCFGMSTTTASSESSTSGIRAIDQACPPSIRNTKLQLSLYVNVPATSLGVWRISVYNAGGTRMSLASDSSSVTTLPGGFNGQFVTTFDADSSATYTVSLTQTTRTSANTLYVTNISIGNGITAQGSAVAPYNGSFTPDSGAFGTITAASWTLDRVGSNLVVTGRWTNGTVGGVDAAIALPSGLTIDSTRLSSSSFGEQIGIWTRVRTTSGPFLIFSGDEGGVVFYDGSTTNKVFLTRRTNSSIYTKDDGSDLAITGCGMSVQFSIPIAEWAGNGTVNLGQGAQVQYLFNSGTLTTAGGSDTTNFAYGPQGVAIQAIASSTASSVTTFRVRNQNPLQAGTKLSVEVSQSQSGPWIDAEEAGLGWSYQARARFGVRAVRVSGSTTDIDVQFGNSGASPSSGSAQVYEAQNVDPWSNYTSWFWRVSVYSPSAPVGFGIASAALGAGLYLAGSAPGTLAGGTIASGNIGEVVEVTTGATQATTTNVAFNVSSMSVPAGRWKIEASVFFNPGDRTGNTYVQAGLSTTTLTLPSNYLTTSISTNNGSAGFPVMSLDVNFSSTTTVYLVMVYNFSGGAPGTSSGTPYIKRTRIA